MGDKMRLADYLALLVLIAVVAFAGSFAGATAANRWQEERIRQLHDQWMQDHLWEPGRPPPQLPTEPQIHPG